MTDRSHIMVVDRKIGWWGEVALFDGLRTRRPHTSPPVFVLPFVRSDVVRHTSIDTLSRLLSRTLCCGTSCHVAMQVVAPHRQQKHPYRSSTSSSIRASIAQSSACHHHACSSQKHPYRSSTSSSIRASIAQSSACHHHACSSYSIH